MYKMAAPHIRRVIVLGMAAGPRIGPSELFQLAWADVELAAGYMRMPNAAKGAKEDSRVVPIRDDILPPAANMERGRREVGLPVGHPLARTTGALHRPCLAQGP